MLFAHLSRQRWVGSCSSLWSSQSCWKGRKESLVKIGCSWIGLLWKWEKATWHVVKHLVKIVVKMGNTAWHVVKIFVKIVVKIVVKMGKNATWRKGSLTWCRERHCSVNSGHSYIVVLIAFPYPMRLAKLGYKNITHWQDLKSKVKRISHPVEMDRLELWRLWVEKYWNQSMSID